MLDSQGQILVLAFRVKFAESFELFPLGSEEAFDSWRKRRSAKPLTPNP
jgi:hypothetical protein